MVFFIYFCSLVLLHIQKLTNIPKYKVELNAIKQKKQHEKIQVNMKNCRVANREKKTQSRKALKTAKRKKDD
jgi:hypothetical protein